MKDRNHDEAMAELFRDDPQYLNALGKASSRNNFHRCQIAIYKRPNDAPPVFQQHLQRAARDGFKVLRRMTFGSWPRVSLHSQRDNLMLPVSRIRQHGRYVFRCQLWEVILNLLLAHPARQHGQNVVHRDAQPTDARPAAAFAWFQCDSVHVKPQIDSL